MNQAIELDPAFPKKIGQIVLLGGAFSVNGNVNPAAEANVCLIFPGNFCMFIHMMHASMVGVTLDFHNLM